MNAFSIHSFPSNIKIFIAIKFIQMMLDARFLYNIKHLVFHRWWWWWLLFYTNIIHCVDLICVMWRKSNQIKLNQTECNGMFPDFTNFILSEYPLKTMCIVHVCNTSWSNLYWMSCLTLSNWPIIIIQLLVQPNSLPIAYCLLCIVWSIC